MLVGSVGAVGRPEGPGMILSGTQREKRAVIGFSLLWKSWQFPQLGPVWLLGQKGWCRDFSGVFGPGMWL